jgi:hypothetical protein
VEEVDSVSLEECDGDGFTLIAMHDAGTFTENFNGTDAGATAGEDVGVEDFVS